MKADAQEFMHGKIGCPACQPHPMLCPLHATAIELLAALKVAREWMGSDAPRQSLKLHKAQNMVDVAISHAEGR